MNLPDWLSLSATSGTGSGKITATVDKCTARAARRTTEFSVKTDSGSSRRVRVIQNGIAEFVNITTSDISVPNTVDDSFAIAVVGTSNSAILTFTTSGSLLLTNTLATVTDENGTSVNFISGSPIDGDPGASAMYSFTLVFKTTSNTSANELKSVLTIATQSGDTASINITQAAGSGTVATLPYFTNNGAREVAAAGTADIGNIVVYNPGEVAWDILAVPNTGLTITEGTTENYLTPVTVAVTENTDTENTRSFVLYLVPEGAVNTSVVYSSLVINQLAAPVNPFIEGETTATSYAGGLITLRIIDQKNVGWYPQVVYASTGSGSGSGSGDALECLTTITGRGDVNGNFTDAPIDTVFNQEYGNTKVVGDGTVKILVNSNAETGDTVTLNLCVSLNDTTTEPYDYVTVTISNIPQFDFDSYEIVLMPNEATKTDTLLTLGNPNAVPFMVVMRNNPQMNRKADITANGSTIYDESESVAATVFSDVALTLSINAKELGAFEILLKSQDGNTIFDTIAVGVYRNPAMRFAVLDTQASYDRIIHVTERFTNTATVYSHYAGFNDSPPQYSESDIISDASIVYSLVDIADSSLVALSPNGEALGLQCTGASFNIVTIRATFQALGYYKETSVEYRLAIARTNMYAYFLNSEIANDTTNSRMLLTLYTAASAGYSKSIIPQYTLYIDDYATGTAVRRPYTEIYPNNTETLIFSTNADESVITINPYENYKITAISAFSGSNEWINYALNGLNNYYTLVGGQYYNDCNIYFDILSNSNYQFTVTYNGLPLEQHDDKYYLFWDGSAGGGTRNIVATLTNTINGNAVATSHVLRFRFRGNTYGEDFTYKDAGNNNVLAISSTGTAMNVADSTHTESVHHYGNSDITALEDEVTVSAYADTTYSEELGQFTFYMRFVAAESYWFNFLDNSTLEWYENVGGVGMPCTATSDKDFSFGLRSSNTAYEVGGKKVKYAYKWYTINDSDEKTQIESGDTGWQWLMANDQSLSGSYEEDPLDDMKWYTAASGDTETTSDDAGSKGDLDVEITWAQNNDTQVRRGCQIRVIAYKDSDCLVEAGRTVFTFVQSKYAETFHIKLWNKAGGSGAVEIAPESTRQLESDYDLADESTERWVVKAYVNDNEVTSSATITYAPNNYQVLDVNSSTGALTLLGDGIITVTASYSTFDTVQVQYYVAVTEAKDNTTITIVEVPTLTYKDDFQRMSAYSDSGANVTITPKTEGTSKAGRVVVEEDTGYVIEQGGESLPVTVIRVKPVEASSALQDVAGDVLFELVSPETGTHKQKISTQTINIAKYQDAVTNWDCENIGESMKNNNVSKTFTLETRSGRAPSRVTVTSQYSSNASITYPVNGNYKKFTIIPKKSGTYQITMHFAEDDNYSATSSTKTYSISALPITSRSISFNKSSYSGRIYSDITLDYTISPNSTSQFGTVTLDITNVDTGRADVISNTVVRGRKRGTVKVTATLSSHKTVDREYASCSAETTVTIQGYENRITFTPANPYIENINDTISVTATATNGVPAFYIQSGSEYSSGLKKISESTGTNSRTLVIKGLATGTYTNALRAYATESGDYAGTGNFYCDVQVAGSAPQESCAIYFNNDYSITSGSTETITGWGLKPQSGATVTFSSGTTSVATIATTSGASANISGVYNTTGTSRITVTVKATGYTDYTTYFDVNVTAASVTSRAIIVGYTGSLELYVPGTGTPTSLNLNVSTSPSGETVNYLSSNTNIATVNNGVVTAVAAGSVSIDMWLSDRTGYGPASAQRTITVISPDSGSGSGSGSGGETAQPDGITFYPSVQNATVVNTDYFVSLATANSGRTVQYSSSDVTAARVLGAYVQAKAGSSGTSTVITLRNSISSSSYYTCTIAVSDSNTSKNLKTLDWTTNAQTISVKTGDNFYLYASVMNSNISNGMWVSWESAKTSRVTVNGGVVKGMSATAKSATITASVPEGRDANDILRQSAQASYQITSEAEEPTLHFKYTDENFYFNVGQSLAADFNVAESNSTGLIEYTTNNTSIASFGGQQTGYDGIITLGTTNSDNATITATQYASLDGRYKQKVISYKIYLSLRKVQFMAGLSSYTPITTATLGDGYARSYTAYISYTDGGIEYDDTYTQLSAFAITSSSKNGHRHVVTFSIPANTNQYGQSVPRTLQIMSNIGQATASLVLTQPACPQYEIVYAGTGNDIYATFANSWDLTSDMGGGAAAGGTDEQLNEPIGHINAYSYGNIVKGATISYYTTASWLKVYIGDGNTSGATAPTSSNPSSYTTDASTGIGKPHLLWEANNSSSERTASAVFTYGTITLTITVMQKGTSS